MVRDALWAMVCTVSLLIPITMLMVVLGIIFFQVYGFWSRAFDLRVLWPIFKRQARSLELAREGFVVHMGIDPKWQEFCGHWDDAQFMDWVETHLR